MQRNLNTRLKITHDLISHVVRHLYNTGPSCCDAKIFDQANYKVHHESMKLKKQALIMDGMGLAESDN